MDWLAFREGFWLVVQIAAVFWLAFNIITMLRKAESRQMGLAFLGAVLGVGLVVGLIRGLGVRITIGE